MMSDEHIKTEEKLHNLGCLSVLLVGFGSIFLTGSLVHYLSPFISPFYESLLYGIIYGVAPITYGLKLSRDGKRLRKHQLKRKREAEIIQLAVDKKGQLTHVDVTLALKVTMDEAAHILNSMYEEGIFQIDTQENVLVYQLNNYLAQS